MLRGIYSAASGLISSQTRQDAAANNIANSNTTGFKQDKIVTKPFAEVMLQNKDKTVFGTSVTQQLGSMPFGVENGEVYTDFKQGDIQETGKDLDIAISGKGFFTARYFDGIKDTIKYSRDGSFSVDSEGKIVTSEGGYLLGRDIETGETGPVIAGNGKVQFDKEGTVSIDGVKKYSLIISDFDDYNNISKEGKNAYAVVNDNIQPIELQQGTYEIHQGSLEQSNIDIANEMVSMVTNLRSFQANQKVIQSLDETLSKTVNEVGALR